MNQEQINLIRRIARRLNINIVIGKGLIRDTDKCEYYSYKEFVSKFFDESDIGMLKNKEMRTAITFEQFKKELSVMKTTCILPGYKLVLENGNVFVVMEYKNTKIAFPEGSSRTLLSLDELCEVDLTPKPGISRIMKVLNALNIPIWERKFTRSEIKAGFTITNENDVKYIVVGSRDGLRIVCTELYIMGPKLDDIVNEDLSPVSSSHAEIMEIRNREGEVVYSKK